MKKSRLRRIVREEIKKLTEGQSHSEVVVDKIREKYGSKLKGNENKILDAAAEIMKKDLKWPNAKISRMFMDREGFVPEVIEYYNKG